ncbi:MAG: TIGR02266 family protein [Acidobacteriota bacterium]|nr:TIGR02266 family protein [Acidobacteriota bacterium]
MGNTTNRQASIDSRRVALEREIAIRVPRFDTFVTEYSANISTTGMFIVSEKPQPPGTSFSFEFSVADDWKLIRGKAQVVWSRYRDEGPERPPGMGVRFLEVDAQSRRLIRWIVEKHIREGGKPFELDELRTVIDQALEDVVDADSAMATESKRATAPKASRRVPQGSAQAPARFSSKGGSERRVVPLLLTAAVVLALVGILFWLTEWLPGSKEERSATLGTQNGSGSEVSAPALESASPGATPVAADPTTAANAPPPPEPTPPPQPAPSTEKSPVQPPSSGPAPPVGSAYKSVMDSVTSWAEAWSSQDTDRYLSHYASTFAPGGGLSRRQWEIQRRQRLSAPRYINVSITSLDLERLADDRVRVSFTQTYRSDRFGDMVRKTLDLVWEGGRWRIAREGAA